MFYVQSHKYIFGNTTMRITEIADAQAQLELWKLVNDSVWTAIQTQAQQQKRAEAERKAQAKLKPRVRKPTKAPYASPPPPLKKPHPLITKTPTPTTTPPNPQHKIPNPTQIKTNPYANNVDVDAHVDNKTAHALNSKSVLLAQNKGVTAI